MVSIGQGYEEVAFLSPLAGYPNSTVGSSLVLSVFTDFMVKEYFFIAPIWFCFDSVRSTDYLQGKQSE